MKQLLKAIAWQADFQDVKPLLRKYFGVSGKDARRLYLKSVKIPTDTQLKHAKSKGRYGGRGKKPGRQTERPGRVGLDGG